MISGSHLNSFGQVINTIGKIQTLIINRVMVLGSAAHIAIQFFREKHPQGFILI